MATAQLFPKVNINDVTFDPDKWEEGEDAKGRPVFTLKPGQTDDVVVDMKPPSPDKTISCGEGSTITLYANDYKIVKRP